MDSPAARAAENVMESYDVEVDGLSLDDAIDVTETLIADLQERLGALRDDKARKS